MFSSNVYEIFHVQIFSYIYIEHIIHTCIISYWALIYIEAIDCSNQYHWLTTHTYMSNQALSQASPSGSWIYNLEYARYIQSYVCTASLLQSISIWVEKATPVRLISNIFCSKNGNIGPQESHIFADYHFWDEP